jgi:hypothetical protein
MQIERVIGGVGGDATAQAVQIRMRSIGQNLVNFSRIRVWDAAGSNPVLIVAPAAGVANGGVGDRVLIASASFLSQTTPATVADFAMANVIPASYLAAGSMTFESSNGATTYWRLSWGGASYTGNTMGSITNDGDGEFAPNWPGALPSAGSDALMFDGIAQLPSSNNAADYVLTPGDAVFTNNAGASFTVNNTASAIGPVTAQSQLHQNHPNPFNPSTTISFTLVSGGQATLEIFNTSGRRVTTLFRGVAPAGLNEHRWDGRNAAGRRMGSGIYYYRLSTNAGSETRKMLMLK